LARPGEIDEEEHAYGAARDKLERALTIRRQIRDRSGEALTLHHVATIDLMEGAHSAAKENFYQALLIRQEIGDRAGEAQTFHQLGVLAIASGNPPGGLALVTVCYLIDRDIGHGDAESDLRMVTSIAEQLKLTPQETARTMQLVADAYARDRGAEMLRQAFPNSSPGGGHWKHQDMRAEYLALHSPPLLYVTSVRYGRRGCAPSCANLAVELLRLTNCIFELPGSATPRTLQLRCRWFVCQCDRRALSNGRSNASLRGLPCGRCSTAIDAFRRCTQPLGCPCLIVGTMRVPIPVPPWRSPANSQ
jgi:hypothetical protein